MQRIVYTFSTLLTASSLAAHERTLPHLHTEDAAVDLTSVLLFSAIPLFIGAVVYLLRVIRER
jgi:hypothetical protein